MITLYKKYIHMKGSTFKIVKVHWHFIKNCRFRQDGIEKNPIVVEQSGVLPYKTGSQAHKYSQIIRFIPDKQSNNLPYNIMTDVERVSLMKEKKII